MTVPLGCHRSKASMSQARVTLPTEHIATHYPNLSAPLDLGPVRLRNRIVHLSMTTRFGANRQVTQRLIDYHANRARGGAAMTITEPVAALPAQQRGYKIPLYTDDSHDGLSRWAEAVREQDCHLVGQFQDSGRGRREKGRNPYAYGASSLPDDLSWTIPHAMSIEDIERMIDGFAAAARRLQAAGFSGVEISGGHGHLFHQFLSPWSNHREDRYGGDLDGRVRFLRELIDAVDAVVDNSFVLGLKLPGDDGVAGSISLEEAARITARLADPDKIDFLSFAQGSHARSLEMHIPDMHGPRIPYLELTRQLKLEANGIPVIAIGLITDPVEGEALLADGDVELVGVGRAMITDAAWGAKAFAGREPEIRYCVSCNTCWASIVEQNDLACDNNPRLGTPDEADWWPAPASGKRRIAVVGAGIAGMEAAWIAAARGHQVTVFGASDEVGGKTRLHAELPGGEHLSSIYDYQQLSAERAGADLRLGDRASVADILSVEPDEVILATGSEMSWPHGIPDELRDPELIPDLRAICQQLVNQPRHSSGTAVIFDADHTQGTYDAAEFLDALFDRVVILTPRERLARDVGLVTRQGIYRRLYAKRIEIVVLVEPADWEQLYEARLGYRNVLNGDTGFVEDLALFSFSTPRVPNDALAAPLREAGLPVRMIGDCYTPRTVLAATREGHDTGMAV